MGDNKDVFAEPTFWQQCIPTPLEIFYKYTIPILQMV